VQNYYKEKKMGDENFGGTVSTAVNAWGSLTWIISLMTTQVAFLDVMFSLQHGCMNYTLYAKALNLHLYLPPHSAHPPGILKGMVYGMFFSS
jgi:hypothetical protein